MKVLLMLIVYM